jgi:undecaprenyl diphosphate synthase
VSPRRRAARPPSPHPSGARPPAIPREFVPRHVAIVMDGNGRWAKQRGLPRTVGHEQGESSLFDVVEGAIEVGVQWLSAYAFSTENWKRSPDEVRFLMGFNRDVIRRRRDEMHAMGVRVRWAGRRPRLWKSVIDELETAEALTRDNRVLMLTSCVNYGGR